MRRWSRFRNNAQELDILILQRNNLIAPRHEALLQGLFFDVFDRATGRAHPGLI
jgi:hypothetical protein